MKVVETVTGISTQTATIDGHPSQRAPACSLSNETALLPADTRVECNFPITPHGATGHEINGLNDKTV
jgi:hypothetical protein